MSFKNTVSFVFLFSGFALSLSADASQDLTSPSQKTAFEEGRKSSAFQTPLNDPSSKVSSFQKKPDFFEKKFQPASSSFGKEALGFDKKIDNGASSSFNKSASIESKSYSVKSSDLGKESSLQKKDSDLLKKGSAGFDKSFESKSYEGPENPQSQHQKEIREILKQKGGDGKSGDAPLSIDEVKQIVNRDSHRIPPQSPRVDVPKESAIDSRTSTR